MNHSSDNGVLTFYPKGDITSTTAPELEREISEVLAKETFASIVLDFSKVPYLSSAGLRIVLKLKQRCKDTRVINVSSEVFDIFEMTGFTKMMEVEKKLVEVNLDGAELIGEGYFSLVYRIDKDTIIKVCRRVTAIEEVRRELNLAKQAFILGIPTAISFDVVQVGDKLGVRFEMLDCASLRDVFRDVPQRYEEMVQKYAELLKTINGTNANDPTLPKVKDEWIGKLEKTKEFYNDKDYAKLMAMIEAIPARETFVHGDCHFKNIMVQGDDLLLIDMDTLAQGHPIFELAAIYAPYVAFEESDPGNSERFLGMPASFVQPMFRDVLNRYFNGMSEEIYEKIALLSYVHMVWWNKANSPENKVRHEWCLKRCLELLPKYDSFDIGI